MADTDKPKLKPANENPWYCLATLHGEQPDRDVWSLDFELTKKNRKAWNRWFGQGLPRETKAALIQKGFPEADFAPLTDTETVELREAFVARRGVPDAELPNAEDSIDFAQTHFVDPVDFSGFLFTRISFHNSKFSARSNFGSATFSTYADFRSATFSAYADFRSATFSSEAEFLNVKFQGYTTFVGTTFAKNVPDFRGASFHEATEWHDAKWPPPPSDRERAHHQVYAYQRLKQEMERLKKHDDELFFFKKELRAKRAVAPLLSPEWIPNALYDAASGYGQSIGQPLLWLFELFLFGMIFFMEADAVDGASLPWPDAASLSFANIFSFLGLKREFFDQAEITRFSGLVKIAGAAEAVAGAILLFLFGLALRNRFRIK